MKIFLFIWFLLILTINALGQNNKTDKHPIDLKKEQCLEADFGQTTYGMINCEQYAEAAWDKELNRYYKLLMTVLKNEEKVKLKAAQLKWLEYRDKELEFSDLFHNNLEGSMWKVAAAARRCNIIKQRVLELKNYYETNNSDN